MAMFDYTGAEADELSFREGDVLIQVKWKNLYVSYFFHTSCKISAEF